MEFKHGEEMITLDNVAILEALKSTPEYNAEVDRIKLNGITEANTALTGQHTTAIDQLNATHASALQAANMVSSGKSSEQIEGLISQVQTLTETVKTSESNNVALQLKNKLGDIQTELINDLDGVINAYDKQNLTRDAMALLNPETGKFRLVNGVEGTVSEIVAELKQIHPDRFGSKQPAGAGIRGGQTGSPVSGNTIEDRLASKIKNLNL